MTERTDLAARTGGATRANSAAAAAGLTPADRPAQQRDADDVPLEEGAVQNGGAFMGGDAPGDAKDARDEPRQPLDSRQAFGGDGASYVDPAIEGHAGQDVTPAAFATGDDGFDETAGRGVDQDRD